LQTSSSLDSITEVLIGLVLSTAAVEGEICEDYAVESSLIVKATVSGQTFNMKLDFDRELLF
jgi:hypothetical protein